MRTPPIPGTLAIATARSLNRKIGDAATTYAAQGSCPSSCVFKDGGGCYAESGSIGKFVTQPLNHAAGTDASPEDIARFEADEIDALEVVPGRVLRLHTVGDCPTDEAAAIVGAAAGRYMDRGGGPVWTYTHAWREVERASWARTSVLASCETWEDVDEARARGYATAMVVEEFTSDKLYKIGRADGAHNPTSPPGALLPCPQQTRGVACSDCRLCMNDGGILERGYTIGFELHGTAFVLRQGRKALRTPADPERRMTTRELIPRYLVEHPEATDAEMAKAFGMSTSSIWEMRRRLSSEGVIA